MIRKLWRKGGQIQRYTMLTTGDESEALGYEVELIKLYGQKNLTNKTDGGEDTSGQKFSTVIRKKMSCSAKALS